MEIGNEPGFFSTAAPTPMFAQPGVLTVFNVVETYGADPTGRSDSTKAIQSAINAAMASAGGIVYFPPGQYRVSGTLLVTKGYVTFWGCGYGYVSGSGSSAVFTGSVIWWNSPSSSIDIIFASGGLLGVRDLGIVPFTGPNSSGGGYNAIHTQVAAHIDGVTIVGVSGTGTVTTGVYADNAPLCIVEKSDIGAWTQAVWMSNGELCTVKDSVLSTVAGTNSGSVRMDNGANTLRLQNSQTQGGDRGLYMLDGTGSAPAFVFIDDFEINNPEVAGAEFVNGSQVYGTQLWVSSAGYSGPNNGLLFDSTFTGGVSLSEGQIQDFGENGLSIEGGSGYTFTGYEIGGSGSETPNTYDDVSITGPTSNVSLIGAHIGVDPWYSTNGNAKYGISVGTSTSKINIDSSCIVGTGYGTASLDPSSPVSTGFITFQNSGGTHMYSAASVPAVITGVVGDLWFDTATGITYECVTAGTPGTWSPLIMLGVAPLVARQFYR
jgi:hypothetical protein